jgi:hypothetical protein
MIMLSLMCLPSTKCMSNKRWKGWVNPIHNDFSGCLVGDITDLLANSLRGIKLRTKH